MVLFTLEMNTHTHYENAPKHTNSIVLIFILYISFNSTSENYYLGCKFSLQCLNDLVGECEKA